MIATKPTGQIRAHTQASTSEEGAQTCAAKDTVDGHGWRGRAPLAVIVAKWHLSQFSQTAHQSLNVTVSIATMGCSEARSA